MTINKMNSPLFSKGQAKWDLFVSGYSGPYDLTVAVYAGLNNKISFTCPIHGGMVMDAKVMMRGAQCNKCAFEARKGKRRMTQRVFEEAAAAVHGGKYSYEKAEYAGQRGKVEIRCPEHGVFTQMAGDHLSGSGCPKCFHAYRRGTGQRGTLLTFTDKLQSVFKGVITLVDEVYVNSKTAVEVRCTKHGTLHVSTPCRLVQGENPCARCNHMKSGTEDEVATFLEQFTIVERRNRGITPPKEIDIWLPEFRIGVEFHGLYHHLTSKRGLLHREKWELAQKAGIRLVQIFEDEWLNKQDIVKARLLAFIGKSEKRDARKLVLKDVQWKEARDFLAITHIQGAGPVGAAYGLYEGGRLLAVATFGRSRSGAMMGARRKGEYEVLRYASIGSVRGGFTRLFAQFKKDFTPDKVISYCDLRYGTGGLYKAAGFELAGVTEPDYWWVPRGKIERVSRYSAQKHKMKKANHPLNAYYAVNKTERMICEEAGWEQIHGVGNQKWVWSNPLP